jgi:precorrin-6B methylase 2
MWPLVIGAAWTPTSRMVVRRMLEMAEVDCRDIVYDLGSGDGRIVIEATKRHQAKAVGIEADPLRVFWSRLMIIVLGVHHLVKIVWGNIFHQDISEATVVTLFLLQKTNQKLKPKLQQELKPGTRIVSYWWDFSGWVPTQVDKKERIYMYVMGQSDRSQTNH